LQSPIENVVVVKVKVSVRSFGVIYDEQEALIRKMENGYGERFNRSIRAETQKSCRQDRQSRLPLHGLRLRLLRLSVFGDHDLLSTAKSGSVLYARKDAKATNSSSLGAKAGDGNGPRSPDVSKPDTKDLLKRMRKVDPNQSRRYRQRAGE
jgi:hypothetical protein